MSFHRALRASVVGAAFVLLAAACGGGSSASEADGGLEKTNLKVGYMPIVDDASLFIAKKRGFFKDEGLTVEPVQIAGGADGIPKMVSGALDISWGNYVSTYLAVAKGLKLKVVMEGYNAEEGTFMVMALPNSGIREPKDLKGKTVAVNTLGNVGTMTVSSVLRTNDVNPDDVKFVEVPFPEMAAAMESGAVDAGWMGEPQLTQVRTELGAHEVLDSNSGATEGFPIAGYMSTEKFVSENPDTVAAFQRAIKRAQKVAQDRSAVEEIVPTYTKISPETAAIMKIATFPTTTEVRRIQRVGDLMHESGLLKNKIDASKLVVE